MAQSGARIGPPFALRQSVPMTQNTCRTSNRAFQNIHLTIKIIFGVSFSSSRNSAKKLCWKPQRRSFPPLPGDLSKEKGPRTGKGRFKRHTEERYVEEEDRINAMERPHLLRFREFENATRSTLQTTLEILSLEFERDVPYFWSCHTLFAGDLFQKRKLQFSRRILAAV
ncbi:hypothetical protein TNCT_704831 [Trichonephila clavata]|uniref:Uncharacterized protein n=1 Tax=Trichonephila clavata TaxID=2740835 RepID=A0A8X6FP81_TRICU|nr:hypothetical protein TNCT_704831 [Trichonephila clavata]